MRCEGFALALPSDSDGSPEASMGTEAEPPTPSLARKGEGVRAA
jgi:hypothetical protein